MLSIEVDKADPKGNETIWLSGKPVGNVTSGCYSPAIDNGLAFAYIPTCANEPGFDQLRVEIMGQMRKAVVLENPPKLTFPQRQKKMTN